MKLDGHIHIENGKIAGNIFCQGLRNAGIAGGILISMAPMGFSATHESVSNAERLDNLLQWSKVHSNLYPFYWIDPLENDAIKQVHRAVNRRVKGFKVICNSYYPSDKQAINTFQAIVANQKPILFHSGILWDGRASSKYNRPVEFEALLEINHLKFSLAHISWPWCDELLAVYGKFLNAYAIRPEVSCEMFIDLTPGTPAIYRKSALSNIFQIGYDIENNLIFGSDCSANNYDGNAVRNCMRTDTRILKKLGVSQRTIKKLLGDNLCRFVGDSGTQQFVNDP